ncbi:MAG TPA: cytochrome c oxidase assembly protein [Terriglobales bacterium]|jgi:cytochrome c oxidase assembly factor CtaG|nr:cytochrome c oxidase assembly protein [Terriglobales bacterium]
MMSHIHLHHSASESLWISGASIFASLVYLRGWLRLRRQEHDNIAGWRAGSFLVGLLLIWIATASPLAALDHEMLTAHMVQHLLLMTLAPPLILFGRPRKPLAHGLPRRWLEAIGRPLRSQSMKRLASVVTHPALCWLAAAGTLVVWHIPSVFMLGLRSQMWHGAEQASFLATGLLFWSPVVRPLQNSVKWPESSILLYLFLATLPCDILSGFLVFCDRVVYPVFLSSPHSFGLSALEDQQCAGALMWTCVTVVYLIAGAVFTARLLSPHRSPQRSEEFARSEALAIPQFDSRQIAEPHADPHGVEMEAV